jgi:hypothetical protein
MGPGTAGQWRPPARPRPKEGIMFRRFILAALELVPGLLTPLGGILDPESGGDNRGSIDPNG